MKIPLISGLEVKKMQEKYPVMKTGNFYFPYLYSKDKFTVEDTIDISITGKNVAALDFVLKRKNHLLLSLIAEIIWASFKEQVNLKKYKNCWFVPHMIYKMGKEYVCSVDVLRKVR